MNDTDDPILTAVARLEAVRFAAETERMRVDVLARLDLSQNEIEALRRLVHRVGR